MKFFNANQLSPLAYRDLIARRAVGLGETRRSVEKICLDVKNDGESAVRKYSALFDGSDHAALKVGRDELTEARKKIPGAVLQALETAAKNIRTFHERQLRVEDKVETMPGVVCWRERRPIERVGLYVPAGSAPLPSTVLMLGTPATIAGCRRIVLCSPPRSNGTIDALVLAAAEIIGIDEVYCVGGAQAIAAMAYGTKSIPKVDKIFGPGNRYVAAAKSFVSTDPDGAAIDFIAGPSELFVIADETANPEIVAADLLSQAEHDPDSRVVLATTSHDLADRVLELVPRMIAGLPRKPIIEKSLAESFAVVASSLDECVQLANDYAPEHLSLHVRNPEQIVPSIKNAGSVFMGFFAPVTAGDYASGTNHTLPTGGAARYASGVSVDSFMKSLTFQSITAEGFEQLAPTLKTLAAAEGLEAHRQAVEVREPFLAHSVTDRKQP